MFLVSCKKDKTEVHENVTGELFSGVECLLIKTNDNNLLEPTNLRDFKITIQPGQHVVFSYIETETFSICQQGVTIKLISIKDL